MLGPSDFEITSDARFAGFALVYQETLETWIGGRVEDGRNDVYFFVSLDPFNKDGDAPEKLELPAGRYDLFVLADKATGVRVELNLRQLRGSATIRSSSLRKSK